jgi:hypothetical protein
VNCPYIKQSRFVCKGQRTYADNKTTNLSSIDEFVCHALCDRLDVPEGRFSRAGAQQPDGLPKISSFQSDGHSQPPPYTLRSPHPTQYSHYISIYMRSHVTEQLFIEMEIGARKLGLQINQEKNKLHDSGKEKHLNTL